MGETTIVIPCYDEAARLPVEAFSEHVQKCPSVDLLFVDDGSRDGTLALLRQLEALAPERISVIAQQPNRGKAEAVRVGMNAAFERGARYAGYFDADLATPLAECLRMIRVLDQDERCEMVFGARVALMGRRIERRKLRHYLGRVFATVASTSLGLPIYDTQCGAKLFRRSPATERLFAEPFLSSWVFDVEIVARRIALTRGGAGSALPETAEVIHELPLDEWIDVAGSKVAPLDFLRAIWEVGQIHRRYLTRSAPPYGPG
jgi:glycosyltransferase involved in cell wall biosynthesis